MIRDQENCCSQDSSPGEVSRATFSICASFASTKVYRAILRLSVASHKIFIRVLQTGGIRSRLVLADSRDISVFAVRRERDSVNPNETSSAEEILESLVESLPKSSNFDINRTGAASAPYIHFLAQVTHLRALVCKVYIPKTRLSARSCAPGYPMRYPDVRHGCRSGASSNFANVILSVISGLMLVSDFGSSKITANHFAVEFLSLLVFPVSLTSPLAVVPLFMHFVHRRDFVAHLYANL